jgi:hypothetical protein
MLWGRGLARVAISSVVEVVRGTLGSFSSYIALGHIMKLLCGICGICRIVLLFHLSMVVTSGHHVHFCEFLWIWLI